MKITELNARVINRPGWLKPRGKIAWCATFHFASSRESPPVSGYVTHKEELKKAGLA